MLGITRPIVACDMNEYTARRLCRGCVLKNELTVSMQVTVSICGKEDHNTTLACCDLAEAKRYGCRIAVAHVCPRDSNHTFIANCKTINPPCTNECKVTLRCGHPCPDPCGQCATLGSHANCRRPCQEVLQCHHKCPVREGSSKVA